MKLFYKPLKQIEHRPILYTGQNTLKSLHTYICGYEHALTDNDFNLDKDKHEPFFDWVAKKLGFNESTAGWANMILATSIGLKPNNIKWDNFDLHVTNEQHENSITKFYELLEEYVNE